MAGLIFAGIADKNGDVISVVFGHGNPPDSLN